MGTRHGAQALSVRDTRDWVAAHSALSRLAQERAALDAEEGRWLLRALRVRAHAHLGYGSFSEYIERLFGYRPRTTQEKLRVAEALEAMPLLAGALESGALSWCATRELTRVVVADTQQAWLDAARGKTQRELEALVASKGPGDVPDSGGAELPRRRVLRFEVAPDTFATFREAIDRLRQTAGGSLDDDAVLLAMARHVLGGADDAGRSSYQISLAVCSACGGGAQVAGGELVPVDAGVVSMAECDAQRIPVASQLQAANENAHVGAHRAETEAPAAPAPCDARPTPRAKQSIPPALRRAVLARDRRCRAPGCRHATFVDVHHVQPRSEGGRNEASNLIVLCSAHHRATHRGELLIEHDREGSLHLRHADGAPYGASIAPQPIDVHTKVFSALRHLGFREGDVKSVLAELRTDATLAGATAERLLREALCRINARAR